MNKQNLTRKERHKNNFLKTRQIEIVLVKEPILIVCEDSKSSVFYFREKRDYLRLEIIKVKISGDCGSHPSSVVEYAKRERDKDILECRKSKKVPYKYIYCVFDVDDHPNLADAIQRSHDLGFIPIVSNQSFELWYLLHFLDNPPGWMHRDEANKKLSAFIGTEYDKGNGGMHDLIKDKENNAIRLAELLMKDAVEQSDERTPYRNPSTEVHLLIKKLNELAGK